MLDVTKSAKSTYWKTIFRRTINSTKNRAATIRYSVLFGLKGQSDLPLGKTKPMTSKIKKRIKNITNIQFARLISITINC
jgi:hypothetical protein